MPGLVVPNPPDRRFHRIGISNYSREQALERANDRIAICEEGGAEIVELSDELRDQMREASTDLYEQIRQAVGDDELYEMYVGNTK